MAVLWVVLAAALILAGVRKGSQVELAAAQGELESVQAHWAARAGVERAMSVLDADRAAGGADTMLDDWFDNERAFVLDLGVATCAVAAPVQNAAPGAPTLRPGLIDLSARVDINAAPEEQLAALDMLNGGQVNAILDWRDGDDNARLGGAEQTHYDTLAYPYLVRNGPFKSVEELGLVEGIDHPTLRGEDINGNGLLDENENDLSAQPPADDGDGRLSLGLRERAAVHGYEPNVDGSGRKRTNVNTADAQTLKNNLGLSDAIAQAVAASGSSQRSDGGAGSAEGASSDGSRSRGGSSSEQGSSSGSSGRSGPSASSSRQPSRSSDGGAGQGSGGGRYSSLFDLLNVQPARDDSSSSGSSERIELGWLAQHWDELTLTDDQRLTGRINVNTAEPDVLASLPGMTEDAVESIRQRRAGPQGPFLSVGDLYTSKTLSEEQFKKLAERLSVRSGAFEVRSTGRTPLGVRRQIVAVVDRSSSPMSILYWYQSE